MIVRVLSFTTLLFGLSAVAPTAWADETLHDFARTTGELTMGGTGGPPVKDDGDRDGAGEQSSSSEQRDTRKKK